MKHPKHDDILALMQCMTLDEKIGQMAMHAHYGSQTVGPELDTSQTMQYIEEGRAGSILSTYKKSLIQAMQEKALKSRLGIPLFFAYDVIYGHSTVFPISIAFASTFNEELIKTSAEAIAYETAHAGIHLTFAPMVDTTKDPRWGRMMESFGEDPYYGTLVSRAWVEGFQGTDTSHENHVGACAKHYLGYGYVEAGKDYHTVDLSLSRIHNDILPPFEAAVKAGVKSVMTAFNTLDGIPMTAHTYWIRHYLKEKLGFSGVVISDYASTVELKTHRVAKDDYEVAKKCLLAGLDIEMASHAYIHELPNVIHDHPEYMTYVDDAVYRILALKHDLGLFENPFKGLYEDQDMYLLQRKTKQLAYQAAVQSAILLKNDGVLPFDQNIKSLGLLGRFSQEQALLGFWKGIGQNSHTKTLKEGLQTIKGITLTAFDPELKGITKDDKVRIKACDHLVVAIGEHEHESGEAKSKAQITLHEHDIELLTALNQLSIPITVVVFSGRLLRLDALQDMKHVKAIVYAWYLGHETGNALAALLFGHENFSGKLPMSLPRLEGQLPLSYRELPTGRPDTGQSDRFRSRYIDVANSPLYPFGFGLTYSDFHLRLLRPLRETYDPTETLQFTVMVQNSSNNPGHATLFGFIQAPSGEVSRPNKELKYVKKEYINRHSERIIKGSIPIASLGYYLHDTYHVTEGKYTLYVGFDSQEGVKTTFEVRKKGSI